MLHSSIWSCSFFRAHCRILWSSCHSPAAAALIVSKWKKKQLHHHSIKRRVGAGGITHLKPFWTETWREVIMDVNQAKLYPSCCESSVQTSQWTWLFFIPPPVIMIRASYLSTRLALQSRVCSLSSVTRKTDKQHRLSQRPLRVSALRELFLPPLKETLSSQ